MKWFNRFENIEEKDLNPAGKEYVEGEKGLIRKALRVLLRIKENPERAKQIMAEEEMQTMLDNLKVFKNTSEK